MCASVVLLWPCFIACPGIFRLNRRGKNKKTVDSKKGKKKHKQSDSEIGGKNEANLNGLNSNFKITFRPRKTFMAYVLYLSMEA